MYAILDHQRRAEELHFARAAARLYITEPALSQAVAPMERQLEVRLLRRTRSNVELTEAGEELLLRGRRLLADLESTVARVRVAGRGESGLVRVGVAHLAEPLVAPALAAFQRWSQATPVAVFDDVIVLVRPSR